MTNKVLYEHLTVPTCHQVATFTNDTMTKSLKRQRTWTDPWNAEDALTYQERRLQCRQVDECQWWYADDGREASHQQGHKKQRKTVSEDVKFAVCREKGPRGFEYSVKVEKRNRVSVESDGYDYVNTFHFGTLLTKNRASARLLYLNMVDGKDGEEFIRFVYTFAGNQEVTQSIILGAKQLRKCMRKNLKQFVPKKVDAGGADRGVGITSRCTF